MGKCTANKVKTCKSWPVCQGCFAYEEEIANMESKMTAALDYKVEYEKLLEAHKKLCADFAELKRDHDALEHEFVVMRAQLDIVHLIFSK